MPDEGTTLDLDEPGLERAAPAVPARARRRFPRRDVALVAVTAFVVGTATALVTERRAGAGTAAAVEAALSDQRTLAALDVGTVAVALRDDGLRRVDLGEDGTARVDLTVPMSNRGQAPLLVLAAELRAGPRALGAVDGDLRLQPGESAEATARAVVECAGGPPEGGGGGAGSAPSEDVVQLRVRAEDDEATGAVPVASAQGSLTAELDRACDLVLVESVGARAGAPLPDGRLPVALTNVGPVPVRVAARGAPGAQLVADPPLPVRLDPRSEVEVLLTVVPDCAQRPEAPSTLSALGLVGVYADDDPQEPDRFGGAGDGITDSLLDDLTTAGWAARQIALTCG